MRELILKPALLVLLAIGLLRAGDSPKDDAAKKARQQLHGTWIVVSAEQNGEPLDRIKDNRLIFNGEKFTIQTKTVELRGTYKLDPTAKPKLMDWIHTADPLQDQTWYAIYELEKDELKICYRDPNPNQERPSEFNAGPTHDLLLVVCKRQTSPEPDPFADRVVSYTIGAGGGYGETVLPKIVLGRPFGGGKLQAGTDVLSLGKGGTITLEFVDNEVFDRPGPDLLVFENAFLVAPGDDPNFGFFELARVEVSEDGKDWKEFPYDTVTRAGCAGHHPVYANPDTLEGKDIDPTHAEKAGGDPFDLADVGLNVARFIRITDLDNGSGDNGTAGFDLDAVAAVSSRPRK